MLSMLASSAIRHPRRMLLLALAVFLISAAFGATAIGLLNARNPFSDPSSGSARAEQAIENATGRESSPGVVALVSAPPGTPAVSSVARAIAAVPGVAAVMAPAAGHGAGLVSSDGRVSLVVATLRAAPARTRSSRISKLRCADAMTYCWEAPTSPASRQASKRRKTWALPRRQRSRYWRSSPSLSSGGSPRCCPWRSAGQRYWPRSLSCAW